MIKCKICSEKSNFYSDIKNIKLYKCNHCKLVFQSNIPINYQKNLYSYYSEFNNYDYESLYNTVNSRNYNRILKRLRSLIIKKNMPLNFIDIGCGYGELVNFGNLNGWDSYGIDLSKEAINIGKKHGINIDLINLESNLIKKNWSVIFLNEVIEHLNNPKIFFRNLSKIISSKGIIYMTTPNFNSLDRFITKKKWNVFHEEHYFYFSKASLKYFINKHTDFKVIESKTRNINIFLYLNKFLNLNKKQIEIKNHKYRKTIKNNKFFNFLIYIINFILNIFSIGNTSILVLEKK